MAKYDWKGGGRYDIFQKRKEPVWPWVVGAIFVLIILANVT